MTGPGSQVSVRVSAALRDRLDGLARSRGLSRAATLRRLIEEAPTGGAPLGVPSEEELVAVLSEKARQGNVSAVRVLLSRQPSDREARMRELLAELGASRD
jgi:predicted transcriptional regulator